MLVKDGDDNHHDSTPPPKKMQNKTNKHELQIWKHMAISQSSHNLIKIINFDTFLK